MTVYLDVDGVVSPLPGTSRYWGDWEEVPFFFGALYLSKALGSALASLGSKLVWLTTWEDMANDVVSRYFGWEPLPVVHEPEGARRWWKLEAVHGLWAEEHRPFIWADDHISRHSRSVNELLPAETGSNVPPPYLLLSPKTGIGLTPKHVDLMRQFITQHRQCPRREP